MNRRILIRSIVALGLIALIGLFAAPISPLSWHSPAAVEANSSPKFPSPTTTRDVDENTPPFQNIGEPVTATDADNDRLTYSLVNAGTSHFAIKSATGQLLTGAPLDYEKTPSYTVTVKATDDSGESDTIIVTINVVNLDESGSVWLYWNQPQVGTALKAELTDLDGDISSVTWNWERSSNRRDWTSVSETTDTYEPVPGDIGKYLRATASYTDGHGSGKTAEAVSARSVRARPPDSPEEGANRAPTFDAETANRTLKTNSPAGTEINNSFYARDEDRDDVRYHLEDNDGDADDVDDTQYFGIGPKNGRLYTTFDHSRGDQGGDSVYIVNVIASDPSGLSDTIEVTIKPGGSQSSPVITGPSRVEYPEGGTWRVGSYSAQNNRDTSWGWIVGVQPGGGDGDFFEIDDNGVLTFRASPDYDNPQDDDGDNRYNFSVNAYDTNPGSGRPAQGYYSVTVTVTEREDTLEISGDTSITYQENGAADVATYTATDTRTDQTVTPTWNLSGDDLSFFSISNGGVLTFRTPPDYDAREDDDRDNVYEVTVEASYDGATATENVYVTVTNVDEPLTLTGRTSITYVEGGTGAVETYVANDPEGSSVTWDHSGDDEEDFTITGGVLAFVTTPDVLSPADKDTNNVYLVTVEASTAGETRTLDVTVTVVDLNEPPEFPTTETGARSIDENTPAGRNIGAPVAATDPDQGATLTYSLGDSADDDAFDIVATSGQLRTKAALNREDQAYYYLTVSVSDGKASDGSPDPSVDDDITVTITINDVNEPPAFTDGPTTVEYAENDTRYVGYYSADDPEDGYVPLTLAGADVALFSFTGGYLEFIDPPDFEAKGSDDGDNDYQVTVQANVGTDTVTRNVTVTVTNVNEDPAFPDSETGARSVVENTAANQNIGTPVAADDPDTDANFGTLTYTLGGTDASSFNFDTSTGQIKTKDALDKEDLDTYYVTVSVTDGLDDTGAADTTADDVMDVTITVTGENDAPTITGGPTEVTDYAENSDADVETYTATDQENDDITWSLSGEDSGDFEISTSGVLTFKSSPNFESPDDANTNNVYLVTVVASDTGKTDTRAVTVTVNNVNERPAFPSSETGARSVVENTASNQDIGTPVAANDPDTDSTFGTLTYSFGGGTDDSSFAIDTSTGQLKTKDALDKEDKDTYRVTVSVTDGKDDSGNTETPAVEDAYIALTITVTGENDAPTITGGPTEVTDYAENSDTDVGTYTATDQDSPTITWPAPTGDDASFFTVTDGVLKFKTPPNFEAKADHDRDNEYEVMVVAFDGGKSDTRAVTVTVTDVNEKPDFGATTATREVQENTAAGENIGDALTATDPDTDAAFGTLTYTLGGTDASHFDIVATTGQLQTKEELDREDKPSYTVIVSVRDSKDDNGAADTAPDDTITVTITVTDQSEGPEITGGPATVDFAENGTGDVATYTVTDVDTPAASLTWTNPPLGLDGRFFSVTGGVLRFLNPPNYEAKPDTGNDNTYHVTVKVSDGTDDDTQDVVVTVTDANEPPTFPAETATREVQENTTAGQNIGSAVTATDPDAGATLTYSLGTSTDDDAFSIDTSTGQLKTKAALDKETKPSYSVTVSVSDGKADDGTRDPAADDTIEVTITVTDQDDPPEITGGPTAPSYPENGTGNVGTYVATDPENESITWSLDGDDASSFSISGGVLTFDSPPDFEARADDDGNNEYLITVQASDGGKTDTLDVTVTVTDVNEPPAFAAETDTRTVPENAAAGHNIGLPVGATDPDAGATLTYTLDGADAGAFSIVESSGQLQTNDPLDYETQASYSVIVSVSDGKGDSGNTDAAAVDDSITVNITVTNENDPPVITVGDTSVLYSEHDTGDVSAYTATDQDSGDAITWRLLGEDAGSFSISSAGVLNFGSPPDFEAPTDADKNRVYLVTVEAFDSAATDTVDVTITVANVDEAGMVTLSALQPQVGVEITAKVIDPDGINSTTNWQWESSSDGSTGWTTIGTASDTYTPVAADVGRYLRATVSYSDLLGAGKSAQEVSGNPVQATPDTNGPPVFAAETTSRTVAENTAAGEDFGQPVTATDPNSDTLTYSLGGADAESFSIDQSSGQLRTSVVLDFEGDKTTFSVTVTATDPSDESDTITVTITVTDQNEAPTVTRADRIPYPENGAVPVASYTAEDPDMDTITWSLSGTDSARFSVGGGVLTFRASPDYENPTDDDENNVYLVTVVASDGTNSNPTDVIVTVTNVNERPEFPSTETGARSVPENTPAGLDIGLPVSATDPDAGASLIYTLGGTDASHFDIGAYTGQLQTQGALDLETKASYSVTVSVTDGLDDSGNADTAADGTITVTITVTGQDDPPEITGGPTSVLYAENSAGNVATYTATDPENETITWSPAGVDASFFSITGGILAFKLPPDFEAEVDTDGDNDYQVTVQASDGGKTGTRDVTVTVTDVNESPQFPQTETGARSVAENTPAGQDIGLPVAADDPDTDATLTYTLGGTDAASFSIETSSGQLQTKADLDWETKETYSVTVSVMDGKDANGDADTVTDNTITVTITVTDQDDLPEITGGPASVPYAENGTGDVATYTAEDPDSNSLAWTVTGTDSSFFSITGGVLKFLDPPDFEAEADADNDNDYRVTVRVLDGPNADTRDVTVTVTDVNETPAFAAETDTRSVPENTAAGQPIGSPVEASDPDDGASLTYTLGGTDESHFDIATTSGQLQTKDALDKEDKDTYTVIVSVRDSLDDSGASDSATDDTITVTITVTDENEPPEITGGQTAINYAENGTGDVETYTATDLDSSSLTWDLSGDDELLFSIGTTSGILTFKDPPNYEAPKDKDGQNDYQVTVEVSDGPNTATRDVTVNVTGVNEAPAFPSTETGRRSVEEGTSPGQDIGAPVAAVDPEGDTLTYSMTGADAAVFTFDTSTGQLQTKNALDADDKASYSFTVSVTDNKQADGTADSAIDASKTVEITVTDVDEPPAISGDSSPQHAENDTGAVGIYADNDPEDASITWTLSGDDRGDFLISETGELTFKNTPDFETPVDKDKNNIYLVTLTADDGTNTDTFDVTVTVENVNEPPFFPAATAARSVPENTPVGQNIGLPVAARDWDADTTLEYTLGGADDSSFDFDRSTGQLKTKVALDHESKASYTVTVTVTDGEDAAGTADTAADDTVTVTINVTGANDPPVITGSDTLTYDENGTGDVATYTATDQDSGDTITWRLSGTDDGTLSLSSSGVLTFDSPPDFEAPQDRGTDSQDTGRDNEYLVTVEAFDGTVTATLDVTITVSNVDETGIATFDSLQPQVSTKLTAKVVDPDGTISATSWKWEISDDGSTGWTTIANETSEFYTPVTANVGKFLRVTVTYTDALGTSKTLQAVTTNAVQAAPITNTAPAFDGETTTRSVSENSAVGTNVGAPVTATDPQTDTLTYSLVDADVETSDAASFTINQSSGQLRTKDVFDKEAKNSYSVTVKATDPSGLNDTIAVTITVTDQDEAPIVTRTDRVSHPENSTVDIAEYTATDPEGVTIIWSVTGTDGARFSVANGVVTFEVAPDFEAPTDSDGNNVYLVTVVASDGTNSDATDVIVTVTNVNEEPAFPSTENGQRTVAEDTGTGQYIGSPVAARDPDAGDSLTYTLGGADAASFDIVSSTGQLQTKSALEYDTQSRYTVSVTATDTADNSVTIAVAIVVTEVVEAPAPPPPPPPQQRPVPPPPVQRAPTTKPTIDSVTPGNRSLTVAWSAPGDTDGQTITSYDMRHIKSSVANPEDSDWIVAEDVWSTSGDLVYDLIGLDNNAEYNVQVRAGYLVDAGPWSDSETGTPTAGTESDDGCRLTLGSPSGTVTQTGTWTSDCDSVNRIGSYALFYTFTLKQEAELQIDLTSSEDTYLFLLNGAGTDGAVEDSNDDVVVTEDVNSRISSTLAAGAYTIEATTYTPRITGDFTVTITVAGGDGSSVGPPGGTPPPSQGTPPGTTPPGGQQPPGTTPPGGQQPPTQVGPADAPTITSVTPGTETLTVAWTPPSDTGDSEITAYDLRYIHSSVTERTDSDWIVLEDVWTDSGALEYQLTGLTDNIGYDIQARASYAIGSGSWSLTASGTPGTTGSPSTGTPTGDACHVNLKTLTGDVGLTGAWVSDCESVNREGRYARFYSFTLGQAAQVQIDLTSTQDPYLFLLEGGTTDGKVVTENDDVVVNENTNSRIVTTLAAGAHTIEATTYHMAQTGEFSLTISLPQGSGGSGGSPPGSSGPGTPSEDGCEVDLNVLTSRVSREGYWAFDCDSTNRAGRYARYYTFTLRQEAELQIDVVSTEDPFAFLLEGAGKDGEVLAKNDDVAAGTDLNSRISATLAAGRYTIEATTYSEEVAGEFTLTIAFTEAVEDIPDPCVTPLETRTGVVTQTGTWADDCQSTNRIGTYARFYSFTLEQEAELQIDLMSSHDPFLFLLHGDGRDGTLVAQNDDVTVSVDLNSRISMTLAAGTYTIEATTYNTWATGDFTLTIAGPEGASALQTDDCVEDLGTPSTVVTKTGTWTDACDSTSWEGRYARFYAFTLEQQSEVQIDLVSTQDPYLFLLQGTGTNGAEVASNDDIVPNVELDSLISVTLAAGSYTIEATTYDVGETGAFTLTLTP